MAIVNARVKFRRGTQAQIESSSLEPYEVVYCTDQSKLVIYDGAQRNWFQMTGPQGAQGESGAMSEVVKSSTTTLSATECRNTTISNYGQTAEMTLTLPTADAGLGFIFTVITTGYAIHLKAGSSDKIYLDGVALDDGDKASRSSPAVGDSIVFYSFKTGASTYDWIAFSQNGTWVDGGA